MSTTRSVLLLVHTGREGAAQIAADVACRLGAAGLEVLVLDDAADDLRAHGAADVRVVGPDEHGCAGAELVVVFGGDGSILRGAEVARQSGTPLLGVNLGHVGFLAEADVEDLGEVVQRVVARDYDVEERLAVQATVHVDERVVATTWALNEVSVEKGERMLEVVVEVDDRPLSRWGCDGVVCATPTGSTAYNFSAGGPVVWPEVEALLMVPISAHALFARPMVVSPDSTLAIEVLPGTSPGVLWCDGRRELDLPPGARVEVRRAHDAVRLARLHRAPFTDRLVRKFDLPVRGWRGAAEARSAAARAAVLGNGPDGADPDRADPDRADPDGGG